jgi:hypothetical protein
LLFRYMLSAIDDASLEAANGTVDNWSSWCVRVSMTKLVKSIGHGLLAAGAFLIVIYFVGIYVKGSEALRDALDPLAPKNYLVLLALVPGALLAGYATRLELGAGDF